MSDGAVEEIPSCGWNWMGSSEGRDGGDTWCRGCCQSPDSRAFVFSIITRSTSFSSFLPFHERSILPSLFQFFPGANCPSINRFSYYWNVINPPLPEFTYGIISHNNSFIMHEWMMKYLRGKVFRLQQNVENYCKKQYWGKDLLYHVTSVRWCHSTKSNTLNIQVFFVHCDHKSLDSVISVFGKRDFAWAGQTLHIQS